VSRASVFDGLEESRRGFERAIELQDRTATVGFDWPDIGHVLAKVHEELAELEEGIAADDRANIVEEFGDLLFALGNLARKLELDPMAALEASGDKFVRRFRWMEEQARDEDAQLSDESLDRLLQRYQQARRSA